MYYVEHEGGGGVQNLFCIALLSTISQIKIQRPIN